MAAPAPITHPTPDLWTQLQLVVLGGGVKLVLGIVILVVGWTAATYAKRGLEAALARVPMDLTLKPLIASMARYLILILTVLLVISNFGVQTTSLIAVLGAAGLAIGLALQGTLANVASGVMLLVLRPFRVGQFVAIASGHEGTVREIGLFTTLLVTRDGIYLSIPNSAIFSATITNYTRERMRRVVFNVPVDRVNDIELVEKTIAAALAANQYVLKEPAPSAVVLEIQEYSVVMKARAYVRSADNWRAKWSMQKEVLLALAKADILIPVTRQAVVARTEPPVAGNAPPQEDNVAGNRQPQPPAS